MNKPKSEQEKDEETTKKTTARILKEIAKAEGIISAIGDGISILDRTFKILYENQVHRDIFGDNVGEHCYKAYQKRQGVCGGCPVALTFKDGIVHTVEREIQTDKETRNFEITASPLKYSTKIIAGIEVVRDVTERKQTEEALMERERQLNESQRMAHIGRWERDIATNRVVWSDEMYHILGFDPQEDEPSYEAFLNIIHPDDRERFIEAGKSAVYENKPYSFDYRIVRKDGTISVIHARGKVVYDEDGNPFLFRGTAQDITERKRLEEQLLQAQKMESVGQLAGGVAHDFNNLLTAIIGYGNLIKTEVAYDDLLIDYVTQILNSAERAANLTNNLLAFSRRQMINPRPLNMNNIITSMMLFLSRIIGEDVEFSIFHADQDLTVMADKHQIEQVLMNLVKNARDAMPDGGSLTIRTEYREVNNEFIKKHGYVSSGAYALISVEDTGQGMDEETKGRLFDPFYTTKEVGKGTGLGLSMVYGIVKQHNGFIDVESKPGKGTIFNFYIPLTNQIVEEHRKLEYFPTVKRGIETILLAEDETYVRDFIKKILTGHGYKVLEAIDGEDAIKVLHTHKDKIQLAMLDVIMPKKDGKVVYQEIKKISPNIKVIFTSGYTTDILYKKGIIEENVNFISKPMLPNELLIKVREVLDS